jgi:hypothetical protein
MTVQTGAGEHTVLARCCCSLKGFEVGVNVAGVLRGVMAFLAEKRRPRSQELRMVAAMGYMAGQTIFFHRGMLPHEWPALFCVAFEAEFVYRIRLDHLRPELPVLSVALSAFHEAFFQRVVRLLA